MAQQPTSEARERVRNTVPKMIELTEKVLFGDVWERPELSKRDRSLVVCAVLTATHRPEQLRGHLQRALANGLTKTELSEMITHVAFYAGWPAAMTAANIAREVFEANP
jgi:4-carboxymuconolactone decarboxylase